VDERHNTFLALKKERPNMCLTISLLKIFTFALLFVAPSCFGQSKPASPTNAIAPAVAPADIEAAVAALCAPRDIIRSNNGSASGCKTCPKGTQFYGQNMGEWELRNATAGHFTSARDNNLILDGFNCDSHSQNFGGSFVFTLSASKPRLLKYAMGLITEQCHKFPFADGREFLVCRGGWSGQGENTGVIFMVRFDATGKENQTNIFTTTDTKATCGDVAETIVEGSNIKDTQFVIKSSGQMTEMTITATSGKLTCAEANAKRAQGVDPPSVKTYQLKYLFDGKQFTIAPESKSALKAFPE
jgi:hypothetical protein